MEMTMTQKAPSDLHEHIARLTERGLLTRIDRPIDKDSELHPLARWQFQGGLREEDRRAFLFTNVVGAHGESYDIPVLVGGLAASPEIYATGLGVSLWSANAAMKSLFDTLNIVYAEQEKRGFIKLNAVSLTFTAAAVAFVLVAIAAVVVLPVALKYLGPSDFTDQLLRIVRWPALFVALTIALALIYRFGPSREAPKWRWITWGSALAAVLWLAASALFSFYAANFGNFNETYGSLGAVIGFMTWLWISAIVVLLGAELDAEMEHQTARDTTTGTPEPLGNRGARMADSVGAAQT